MGGRLVARIHHRPLAGSGPPDPTACAPCRVNLIMDSLASLALATEAPTDAVLDLPPYAPSQPLLTPSVRRAPRRRRPR